MAKNNRIVARWCGIIVIVSLCLSGCGTVPSLFDRGKGESGINQPTNPANDEPYDTDRPVLRV